MVASVIQSGVCIYTQTSYISKRRARSRFVPQISGSASIKAGRGSQRINFSALGNTLLLSWFWKAWLFDSDIQRIVFVIYARRRIVFSELCKYILHENYKKYFLSTSRFF
jgi:hypothetical protein